MEAVVKKHVPLLFHDKHHRTFEKNNLEKAKKYVKN